MSFVSYQDDAAAVAAGGSSSLTNLILPSNLDQLDKDDAMHLLMRVVSEQLDKDDVVNLLKRMASEYNYDLSGEITRQTKKPRLNNSNCSTPPSSAPTESSHVINSKKNIFQGAASKIKKTTHSDNTKPYTSLVCKVPTEASMMNLMNGYEPNKNTNASMRWLLDEEEVLDWFNIRDTPHIHPVAYEKRRTYLQYDDETTTNEVYAHAAIQSVDIKWDRNSGMVDLKFRTRLVATGKPENKVNVKNGLPWSTPIPIALISPISSKFDVIVTKKRIFKNATAQIKNTEHTNNKKPYSYIVDNVSSEAGILKLMNGYVTTNDYMDNMGWKLNNEEVLDWLNIRNTPNIHPVKNKMWRCAINSVYVHAGIHSVEIRWSRKSGELTLKFRTFTAEIGQPIGK